MTTQFPARTPVPEGSPDLMELIRSISKGDRETEELLIKLIARYLLYKKHKKGARTKTPPIATILLQMQAMRVSPKDIVEILEQTGAFREKDGPPITEILEILEDVLFEMRYRTKSGSTQHYDGKR